MLRLIAPLLDDEKVLNSGRDWKTELLNLAIARGWGDVRYEVTGEGPDHARVYTAVAIVANQQAGTGVGPSKKEAGALPLSRRTAFWFRFIQASCRSGISSAGS